tara:strand:+ start:25 stop:345 length:321 start_codon:yes stop_codon:yes gene_type:complete
MKSKIIDNNYKIFFIYLMNISFVLYILVLFGITKYAPKYLNYTREVIKLFIGLIFIYFYNPFTKDKIIIDEIDKKIFFNCGIILILSSFIYTYLELFFLNKITKYF